ncbi:MAG TPA: hypothetical protein VF251_11575 [Pyrinomonadaceae bacterium]
MSDTLQFVVTRADMLFHWNRGVIKRLAMLIRSGHPQAEAWRE